MIDYYGPGLARITSTMATTVIVVMVTTAISPPMTPPTMAPILGAPSSSAGRVKVNQWLYARLMPVGGEGVYL